MKRQEVQEEELITVDAIGCFEGEEDEEEEKEEIEVADEEERKAGSAATLQVLHIQRPSLSLKFRVCRLGSSNMRSVMSSHWVKSVQIH